MFNSARRLQNRLSFMKLGLSSSLALLFLSSCLHASTTIWEDDFSGASLDSHFSTYVSSGNISQSNGNLVFTTTAGTTLLSSYIYTKTDQNGNASLGSASMYNFYDHPISITLSGIAVTGTPTGTNTFDLFLLMGTPQSSNIANLTPRNSVSGAFARLSYDATGTYTLYMGDRLIGGPGAVTTNFVLIGTPTSLELTMARIWSRSRNSSPLRVTGGSTRSCFTWKG